MGQPYENRMNPFSSTAALWAKYGQSEADAAALLAAVEGRWGGFGMGEFKTAQAAEARTHPSYLDSRTVAHSQRAMCSIVKSSLFLFVRTRAAHVTGAGRAGRAPW